jgi:hypothetical protein
VRTFFGGYTVAIVSASLPVITRRWRAKKLARRVRFSLPSSSSAFRLSPQTQTGRLCSFAPRQNETSNNGRKCFLRSRSVSGSTARKALERFGS